MEPSSRGPDDQLKTLGGIVALMVTAVPVITSVLSAVNNWSTIVSQHPMTLVWVFFLFLVFVGSAAVLRSGLVAKARIRKLDALLLDPASKEGLIGREEALEGLRRVVAENNAVLVLGRVGSDKTALVRALAEGMGEGGYIPIFVNLDGPDAARTVRRAVVRALRKRSEDPASRVDLETVSVEALADALSASVDEPVLIFEDYDRCLRAHPEHKTHEPTWDLIASQLRSGMVKVLILCPYEWADEVVRRLPAEWARYHLQGIRTEAFLDRVEGIVAEATDGKGGGWPALLRQIRLDMGRDLYVSPAFARLTLAGLGMLDNLTVASYDDQGRLPGLTYLGMMREIDAAANRTGLPLSFLRSVLAKIGQQGGQTLSALAPDDAAPPDSLLETRLGDALGILEGRGVLFQDEAGGWSMVDPDLRPAFRFMLLPQDSMSRTLLQRKEAMLASGRKGWGRWPYLLPPILLLRVRAAMLRGRRFDDYRRLIRASGWRLVPYALPPLVFGFALLAEFGLLGDYANDAMYASRLSVFHQPVGEKSFAKRIVSARATLVRELNTRHRGDWFNETGTESLEHEPWTQAMCLGALFRAPETSSVDRTRLLKGLFELDKDKVTSADGQPYGWLRTPDGPYTSSETSLWAITAVAMAATKGTFTNGEFRDLDNLFNFAVLSTVPYRSKAGAAWYSYPNQADPKLYGVYPAVLALQAMLNARLMGEGWPDSEALATDRRAAKKRLDDQIEATAEWLASKFESDGDSAGWRTLPKAAIDEALTLQIYTNLLRCELEARYSIPSNILEAMRQDYISLSRGDRADGLRRNLSSGGFLGSFDPSGIEMINHEHRPMKSEEGDAFDLAWYPWAVTGVERWLIRAQNKDAYWRDIARVRQTRDYLSDLLLTTAVPSYCNDDSYTYMGAELLYTLSGIDVD